MIARWLGLQWRWLAGGLLLLVPVVIGLLILKAMLSPPLVLIEAETGFLSYQVQREDLSSIALVAAEVTEVAAFCAAGLDEEGKVRAVVRPSVGTTVEYHWLPGFIMVRMFSETLPSALVEGEDGMQCRAESDQLTFLLPAETLHRMAPLPVLGTGQIGAELGVPTLPSEISPCRWPAFAGKSCIDNGHHEIPVMTSARSSLHRATARLFGRTSMPIGEGRLYPITDGNFAIPGGARLEAGMVTSPFIGSVTVSGDGLSLRAEVTVAADDMRLYRVGHSQQAESLAAGAIARSINDPSLGPLLFFLALFPVALQIWINMRALLKKGDDPRK